MPMNLHVVSPHDDWQLLHDWDTVSPELALVDPELAIRARTLLPYPGEKEALARISAQLERTHSPPRRERFPTPLQRGRTRHRERWAAPVLVAAALVAIFVLTDVRVEIGKTLASADTADVAEPEANVTAPTPPVAAVAPKPTRPAPAVKPAEPKRPSVRIRRPPVPSEARPETQRFAWAPTPSATGYHVELFRGAARVFAADTVRPALTVPARWRHDGRPQTLRRGEYRWYVWPVISGRRMAEAVVQATLTIPARG
jgi:hypothetical protein